MMSRQTRTNLYGLFIAILLLALCIAYAQVLNQTLEVQGEAEAKAQQGVFITDVEYYSNNGADTANCKVDFIKSTTLKSTVTLGASASSTYTYKVTMYNGTDREQVFIGAITNKSQPLEYSNTNIDYDVNSVTGLNGLQEHVTTIAPGEYITFPVTFKYTGSNVSNRALTSYINFRFREKPVLELSNENTTYTLENISVGHEEEYEFTVSNYNYDYTNGVPMTYSFETTLTTGSPLVAKIYDEKGAEITGSIAMPGDVNTPLDHTYTLKLTWDSSLDSSEYRGQEYTCKVKLKAVPDDTDYAEYAIEKEFGVDITTNSNIPPTVTVEVSDITSTTATITAIGEDENGNTLTYTLEINGETYGPSTTNIWNIEDLSSYTTYTYKVTITDGYEIAVTEGEFKTSGYISEDLILHYDGINNTGNGHDSTANIWRDLSGNENHGTLTSYTSPTWTDQGLTFNGSSNYVYTALNPSQELGGAFTISACFKATETNNFRTVWGAFGGDYIGIDLQFDAGNLHAIYGNGSTYERNTLLNASTIINKISTVTVIFEQNKNISVYLNGSKLGDSMVSGNIVHADHFLIGQGYLGAPTRKVF